MCDSECETRNYYRYYDTPDGCDIPKKVMVAARYGVIAGLILSSFDVLMYSHAVGYGPMIRRYMIHTVPLGLMGATFAIVSNAMLKFRERDDRLNYFYGGLACGPLAGHYLGSKHAILLGGLALGVIGMIKKDAIDNCVTLFPDVPQMKKGVWGWRSDYTLAADPRDEMRHLCADKKQ